LAPLDGRRVVAGLILAATAGLAAARFGAAPIATAAPADAVVLAAVDIHQVVASRRLYAIVHPIALVVQGRYRDAIISGEDVTRLRADVPRSVLHRIAAFTLYDRGRRLGTARVERVAVSPDHTLHCLPLALRGDVRLGPATLVDTDRDGVVEAAGVVVAPLRRPARARFPGEPAPALEVLLVAGLAERGPPAVRLSLPGLVGLGPEVAESYLLQTVLDLDGDGGGELVVLHGYSYEDARYEIYRLRGDRFIRIFAGGYQGC